MDGTVLQTKLSYFRLISISGNSCICTLCIFFEYIDGIVLTLKIKLDCFDIILYICVNRFSGYLSLSIIFSHQYNVEEVLKSKFACNCRFVEIF